MDIKRRSTLEEEMECKGHEAGVGLKGCRKNTATSVVRTE